LWATFERVQLLAMRLTFKAEMVTIRKRQRKAKRNVRFGHSWLRMRLPDYLPYLLLKPNKQEAA